MIEQAEDFRAEVASLHDLVAPLPEADFAGRPTLFKGWTVDDVLRHLHYADRLALHSLREEPGFDTLRARMTRLRDEEGRETAPATEILLDGLGGHELLDTWRGFAGELADAFAAADPKARVRWVGPDMSARSSITARLMETWSHGQAVWDLLGREREEADRLRNVAVIGVNTFGWTFANRGNDPPGPRPALRLTAPSGALWQWEGPEGELIEGPGVDFCRVVTQTRNVADTSLRVTGDTARRWMENAQCFAGPPRTPPAPGARHKAE